MDDSEDMFQADLFIDRSYTSKEMRFGDICLNILALHSTSSTDFDLTGQVIWPASHLLSLYFVNNKNDMRDKQILELGSGVGLSGLVAAKIGDVPNNVTLTDHQIDVLKVLEDNIYLNFDNPKSRPTCAHLAWGEDVELFKEKHGTFDIICGADVVFWPSAVPLLFQTAAVLLKPGASSKLIISYVSRSEFSSQLMFKSAADAGFKWFEEDIDSEPSYSEIIEHQKSNKTETRTVNPCAKGVPKPSLLINNEQESDIKGQSVQGQASRVAEATIEEPSTTTPHLSAIPNICYFI